MQLQMSLLQTVCVAIDHGQISGEGASFFGQHVEDFFRVVVFFGWTGVSDLGPSSETFVLLTVRIRTGSCVSEASR